MANPAKHRVGRGVLNTPLEPLIRTRRPVRVIAACVGMMLAHVGLLVHGILIHFPNVDEIGHLPAAVSKWHFGTFDYYRVNPPLVDLVSGLGALSLRDEYDWEPMIPGAGARIEFVVGGNRLHQQGLRLHRDYILPRLCVIPLSLLGCGLLSWLAYRELGALPAMVACALWCFCPNFLAHAQTIIPDVGSVAVGLLPVIATLGYVRRPSVEMAAVVGAALGLAMLTKLTWLTGLVSLPLAAGVASWWLPTQGGYFTVWWRPLRDWALMVGVAILVLNNGYLLEGSGARLGDYRFVSPSLGGPGASPSTPGNRFTGTWLESMPVPLPANYVLGIDFLRYEVQAKYWSFLRGQWRHGGWWYYYLYTTLVKTPLAILIALLPATYLLVRRWSRPAQQAFWVLAIPALVTFLSVSSQTGFNHHHRYVLAIYPPMYFVIAGAVQSTASGRRMRRAVLGLCGLAVVASLSVWPHFLSFFNRLAGGPAQGWHVLEFSNIDWGQDLLMVEQWLQDHPENRPCWVESAFGAGPDMLPGMQRQMIPKLMLRSEADVSPPIGPNGQPLQWATGPLPAAGWYIVNVRELYDKPGQPGLGYFRFLEPVDRIAYSFLVYRIGPEELQQIQQLTTGPSQLRQGGRPIR